MNKTLEKSLTEASKLINDDEFNNKVEMAVHTEPHHATVKAPFESKLDFLQTFVKAKNEINEIQTTAETQGYPEKAYRISQMPDCVKDMFRDRQRMGTSIRDGRQTFNYSGNTFEYRTWEIDDIKCLLDKKLGRVALSVSSEDIDNIINLMNHGFSVVPSFYGDAEKKLRASVSWFVFNGVQYNDAGETAKTISITVCTGKSKDSTINYTVYADTKGDPRKIGVFSDIEDIIEVFNLTDYIPYTKTYHDIYMPDYDFFVHVDNGGEKKKEISDKEKQAISEIQNRLL